MKTFRALIICIFILVTLRSTQANNFYPSILSEPNGWSKDFSQTLVNESFIRENEWTNLGLAGDSVQCVAVDLFNSQIIWAGALSGCWKTTDGGGNWFQPSPYGYPFKELIIDPDISDAVWGVWGMGSWSDGVFLTTDGGGYWNPSLWMYFGDALVMCSGNHDVMYAAAMNPNPPLPSAGIWSTVVW